MGTLLEGFIYVWVGIIAFIPSFFLGGLAACILASLITYLERSKAK